MPKPGRWRKTTSPIKMSVNKTILIKGGRVIDPENNLDDCQDILVKDGKISKISRDIKCEADKVIEAKGKIILPGLVDMHVHLREPGREDKETVNSGTRAALKGGITTLLAMPNTTPAMDSEENIELLQKIIKNTALNNVLVCAAITRGRKGEELTEVAKFKKHAVVAISDDGASIDNQDLMFKALVKAREQKMLLISHCEDKSLSNNGVVNLGLTSTRLGLRGIARESEYKRVERDVRLAEKARARLHIAHVSCRESVEIISEAKKRKVKVTCETAPHYFSLSQEDLSGYDTNLKMN
ncbi:MAG: dihydroorotase, partial [Candidatus Omnitrophica bacterium]|nr:dihydroorotase [Candidatus Omnitrophota bacterium]